MKTERNGKILPFRYVHCPRCGEQLLYQVEPINGTIKVKCCECKAMLTMRFESGVLKNAEYKIKEICANEKQELEKKIMNLTGGTVNG